MHKDAQSFLRGGGLSVVHVQVSALDVGSDVTIQRESFFEILELILHSCNDIHMYIIRKMYFLGRFTFSLCFNHTMNLYS